MMALNLPAEETLSEISIEEGYVFQLRVSSSDIAKEYFLNVLKNSEKKVRIALPYEATGITTVVLKPDGYKFSGKVRFCDGGEEFPFEYRTNSYGMYVSSATQVFRFYRYIRLILRKPLLAVRHVSSGSSCRIKSFTGTISG